jgi:hypothetical protein
VREAAGEDKTPPAEDVVRVVAAVWAPGVTASAPIAVKSGPTSAALHVLRSNVPNVERP